MPGDTNGRRRVGRETRLLLLTIAISVAALLVLARFRFPTEDLTQPALPAPPLERLAARATYDELAGIIARLEGRVRPSMVVLRTHDPERVQPVSIDDLLRTRIIQRARFVPAIRIARDLALAVLPPEAFVEGVAVGDGAATLVAYDALRNLALVRVPAVADTENWRVQMSGRLASPAYIAAAEAVGDGLALRPILAGGQTELRDPRWDRPLTNLGSAPGLSVGALLFALDGGFIGAVTGEEQGVVTVVPGAALEVAADRLLRGEGDRPGNLGVQVQTLTPLLTAATGTPDGVVVTFVEPDGPAASGLEAGDVIATVDDELVTSPQMFLTAIASRPPGTPVRLGVVRQRERQEITLTVGEHTASPAAQDADGTLGLMLRAIPALGAEVVGVAPHSAAALAGIERGDIITRIGSVAAPTPAQVRSAYGTASDDDTLLMVVQRGDRHLVLGMPKRSRTHGVARIP